MDAGLGIALAITTPWFVYMIWRFDWAFIEGYFRRSRATGRVAEPEGSDYGWTAVIAPALVITRAERVTTLPSREYMTVSVSPLHRVVTRAEFFSTSTSQTTVASVASLLHKYASGRLKEI